MELIFSKDEILEMYLNQIYYGHGSYGVAAAARTYFGKELKGFDDQRMRHDRFFAKSSNSLFTHITTSTKALKRRDHAIRRMEYHGFITVEEMQAALWQSPSNWAKLRACSIKPPISLNIYVGLFRKIMGASSFTRME